MIQDLDWELLKCKIKLGIITQMNIFFLNVNLSIINIMIYESSMINTYVYSTNRKKEKMHIYITWDPPSCYSVITLFYYWNPP